MSKKILWLVIVAGIGTVAWAGPGWGSYEPAFPTFPCQDGWAGCIQGGSALGPQLAKDGSGMPMASDMRVGWFDLEATASFSPFVSLSKYTGEEPKHISQKAANDGSAAADPNTANTDSMDPDSQKDEDYIDPNVSPEAEAAREEEQRKKIEESEANEAQKQAEEEAALARKQEEKAEQEAEEKRKKAERAEAQIAAAKTEEDRAKAEEAARRAKEAEERARQAAADAQRVREERDRQEAEERARAEKAAQASRRAEQERKKKEAEEARKAEERRKAEQAEKERAAQEAERAAAEAKKKAEAEAKKQAEAAAKAVKEAEARAAAAKSEEERKRLEKEAADAAKKAEADRIQAEKEANAAAEKARQDAEKKAEADRKAREEEEQRKLKEARDAKAAEEDAATAAAAVVADQGCDDLVQLETSAILGKLSSGTIQCLETSLAEASRMTQKSKINRMLMVNAFSAGKTSEWERLIKRHLNEIEQSDPELCYKYALHLSKKGPKSAYGVIRWANVALENKTVWTGSTYMARVYSLYKIRTAAAQKIWMNLENKHHENPTDETNTKVKNARNQTKEFARAWYEYAKVAGKDTSTALDMCMSAAGAKDYCEAG